MTNSCRKFEEIREENKKVSYDFPLISVIIPSYNRSHCVCDAILSVMSQTFTDYEIIVIDDGSTDNTKEALQPYLSKIAYIFQENKGGESFFADSVRMKIKNPANYALLKYKIYGQTSKKKKKEQKSIKKFKEKFTRILRRYFCSRLHTYTLCQKI